MRHKRHTPRATKFSPGILAGGVFVFVIFWSSGGETASITRWWVWLVALVIGAVVDAWAGYEPERVPKVKETTVYKRQQD